MSLVRVYQISTDLDFKRVKFEGFNKIQKIDESIYKKVFEGNLGTINLEEIYYILNTKLPLNYDGHSLSVSDVIEISDSDKSKFYFCDVIGFKPIEFDSQKTNNSLSIKVLITEDGSPPYEKYILNDERAFAHELNDCALERMDFSTGISCYVSNMSDKVIYLAYDKQNDKCSSLSIIQANELKKQFAEPKLNIDYSQSNLMY